MCLSLPRSVQRLGQPNAHLYVATPRSFTRHSIATQTMHWHCTHVPHLHRLCCTRSFGGWQSSTPFTCCHACSHWPMETATRLGSRSHPRSTPTACTLTGTRSTPQHNCCRGHVRLQTGTCCCGGVTQLSIWWRFICFNVFLMPLFGAAYTNQHISQSAH